MWQTRDGWTRRASSGCPLWLAPRLLLHVRQVSILKPAYEQLQLGLPTLTIHVSGNAHVILSLLQRS